MKSIIYDIDCLIYFLKIDRADLLEKEFDQIIISNKVHNTISNPSIPEYIRKSLKDLIDSGFVKIEEISLNTAVFDLYYEIINNHENEILGEGEASTIALASKSKRPIAYNHPSIIEDYLKKYDLKCLKTNDILERLLSKDIISKKEYLEIINEIHNK